MTDYIARFVKGGRIFDVASSPYKVAPDFVPPSASLAHTTSSGTSANRFGGGRLVSDSAGNIIFNLPLIVIGDSEPEIRRARQNLAAFLALGSTDEDPMYFEFRPSVAIDQEPLFGQFGANSRLELVFPNAPGIWGMYGVANIRAKGERLDTLLACKPFILGKPQILGTAAGGVTEDRVGVVDGFSKGLSIPAATVNQFLNPIYAYDGSGSNGWSGGTAVSATLNTDKNYVLFGNNSMRLSCVATGTKFWRQTLTLAATSYTTSFYAKLPDGSAVTSSHIQVYFDGAGQTSTYTAVGNGWYRITDNTGTAGGSITAGVLLSTGVTIYVDGHQCEESSIATLPTFGSLIGTVWGGTASASISTRSVASYRLNFAKILSTDEGTIRIVWDVRDTSLVDRYLFQDSDGNFTAMIDNGSQFSFSDGTNTATANADEPSDYEKVVLHFVYGGGEGLKIYRDGVQVATDATYTTPVIPGYFYLGSDNAIANHCQGVFVEFSTYGVAITAAQALADYNIISPLLSDSKAISPIPFLWTKDGDNVVDNHDDTGEDNWAVAGGIPGTHPAITRIDGEISPGWTGLGLWISNFITDDIIRPGDVLWGEQQGAADAGSSGGEYNEQGVSAAAAGTWSTTLSGTDLESLFNREVYLFTRLYDAGANLTIALQVVANGTIITDYRRISTTTAYRLFKTPPITITDLAIRIPGGDAAYNSPSFALKAIRSSGGASNVRVDYTVLMPRPLLFLYPGATAAGNPEGFSYDSQIHDALSKTTADVSIGWLKKQGDRIELVPNKYNALISLIGNLAATTTIANTLTYERIYVTPRWSVL